MSDSSPKPKQESLFDKIKKSEEFLNKKIKWRIAVGLGKDKTEGSVQCVQYVDARSLAEFLDETFGAENWHDDFFVLKETLFCKLTIVNGKNTTSKCGAGEESNMSEKKGEESDAFKRACFKWGIGRFLYESEMKWVKAKKFGKTTIAVDDSGKRIYDLSKHFRQEFSTPVKTPAKKAVVKTPAKTPKAEVAIKKVDNIVEKDGQEKVDSIVTEIEKIGQNHPEVMENCVNHAGTLGYGELSVCPLGILQAFLVRLQKEEVATEADEKVVKTEQPQRPASAVKKEPIPPVDF